MSLNDSLKKIGLSDGESMVYLALLKLGSSSVHKINEEARMHRTTIYDFLEKLLTKGLVNYVIKGGVKYYKATHPNKLLDYIKEKESIVTDILPELDKISTFHKDEIIVEVYKGVEGVKTLLKDVLREGKDHVIFGIDESMFKEKLGPFMDWYFKEEKRRGFKERILTGDDAPYVYEYETALYRYLPPESFNPTPTYVYGDNVAILIWEPFSVIRIKNAALADSYAKYFEILWEMAKKKR
ncbi:MAG TPA: helix-turn-helix domain-containing protein [Candidatus Nanoarchaeia archaeon]|nr:helix-turn-helix domain-containing protein [Candidatus Nanoarchaeia archaeon]